MKIWTYAEERLISKLLINPETGCWEFQGKRNEKGYGQLGFAGRPKFRAHRLAYLLWNGPLDPDLPFVCHSCDNPSCCHPDHLWLGTNRDNIDDRMVKRDWGRADLFA